MVNATPLISSVNAGEFGPRMAARVDFGKYKNACEKLENFLALPQGAARRRPGTRFVAPTKFSDRKSRLIPFEFSTEQAYVIEAGDGYFRFYRDRGQIVALATDAVITNGGFDAGISGWTNRSTGSASVSHDAANGRLNLNGVAGANAHAEQPVVTATPAIERVLAFEVFGGSARLLVGTTPGGSQIIGQDYEAGAHTRAFTPNSSPFYVQFVYTGTGTRQIDNVRFLNDEAVEVPSPYGEADLEAIKFSQSADVLFLAHPDFPLRKLTRRGHESWSSGEVEFIDGPYLDENLDAAHSLTPSGTAGTITLTATKDTFVATDMDRPVRLHGGWGKITAVAGARSATVALRSNLSAATATAAWQLGLWSRTTGYPRAVTFFEQRFWAAGPKQYPQRIDGSAIGLFETFTPGTNDDDAVSYTMSADNVNAIVWTSPGDRLAIGTVGGEWTVQSSDRSDPITPTNIQIRRNETVGSADVQPARVGSIVLFVARDERRVHEFGYHFESDSFRAPDMNILAEHVTESGLSQVAFQRKPDNLLWCVRKDGQLATFTYNRPEDVLGWSRQVTDGCFESVSTIPGNQCDEVWIICAREIAGVRQRHIEIFDPSALETQADSFFVDCGLSYDGTNKDVDKTVALTEGDWSVGGSVTLKAFGHAPFSAASVGNTWHVERGRDFAVVEVTAYTAPDEVTAVVRRSVDNDRAAGRVPATLRNFGTSDWADRDASAVSSVSGLDHLEGATAAILADGAVHPPQAVSGGSVALNYPALKVHVGLPYTSEWRSLRMNAGAARGTAVGQVKRIHRVSMVLDRSAAPRIGRDAASAQRVSWRRAGDAMDSPPPLITGERSIKFNQGFSTDPRIHVVADLPLPCTLLATIPSLRTNER